MEACPPMLTYAFKYAALGGRTFDNSTGTIQALGVAAPQVLVGGSYSTGQCQRHLHKGRCATYVARLAMTEKEVCQRHLQWPRHKQRGVRCHEWAEGACLWRKTGFCKNFLEEVYDDIQNFFDDGGSIVRWQCLRGG